MRATSSKPRTIESGAPVDWRCINLLEASVQEFRDLVNGCEAIIHLAAEIHDSSTMEQLNVHATEALANTAESMGVTAFCYVSSVAVYGSGLQRILTEESPVLTVENDIRSEYWVVDYVRTYGRTKLAGELAIQTSVHKTNYVILRPTVVIDVPDVLSIRNWSPIKRVIAAHRNAHHIYVRDVSAAICWAIDRAYGTTESGKVETFNLSEDEFESPTYADFMRKAHTVCKDHRFLVFPSPPILDWLQDFAKHRTLPIRNPLWRMRFSNEKLYSAGFSLPYGMESVQAQALDLLRMGIGSFAD